jgi:hypothetical protein
MVKVPAVNYPRLHRTTGTVQLGSNNVAIDSNVL